MAAYLIARVTIHDQTAYRRYAQDVPQICGRFGGRFIARGGRLDSLEGDAFDGRVAVIEFPDMPSARAFWESTEYQTLRKIRLPVSDAQLMIVEGVDSQPTSPEAALE
jgi:uncharacterized protein (DUF1330 family)